MTKTAITSAFQKLDAVEQADVLRTLAAALAESLTEEDRLDTQVFKRRRHEVPNARPWAQVRAKINARHTRRRSTGR